MEQDEAQSTDLKASKRKAWTYEDVPVLSLKEVFASRGDGAGYFARMRDGIELLVFFGLKLLPASTVSAIGGFLGRLFLPRWKAAVNRLTHNLRIIRPDASDAQVTAWIEEFADNQGRQKAEYSVVQRLARDPKNIRFVGTEAMAERCKDQPVILIGFHTSNWEILWQSLIHIGVEVIGSYDPPKRRLHHWIVNRVRQRDGVTVLPPGKDAVRPSLNALKQNGNLIVFCDEGFEGKSRAPFLGRPPHLQGNYAYVARLARKTNALLYPVHLTRDQGTRFTLHALEPFRLPPDDTPGGNLIEDVKLINSVVQPVIEAYPGQWYFLGEKIVPL